MSKELLNFGIVGIGGRPKCFLEAFQRTGKARLAAVCDKNKDGMTASMEGLTGIGQYTDYAEMLEKEDLDAVIVGTPMPLHITMSVEALNRGIHVFSEVPAGVSVEECRKLTEAVKNSSAQYMIGENCCYFRPYMIVGNMIREGLLGDIFYAEGEYNHDCRFLIPKTPWRKPWLYDIPGVNYGTHSLGPILSWLGNDRVTSVCCEGSGAFSADLEGNPLTQGSCYIMLCRTEKNRLLKIKNNLSSPRPYGLNFIAEGNKGVYQSVQTGRDHGDADNLIYIEGLSEADRWDTLSSREDRYVPELWQENDDLNRRTGHSGADVLTMIDFINHIYDGKHVPLDVHAGMDMTLPGLLSQKSAMNGGIWVDVPDSRKW